MSQVLPGTQIHHSMIDIENPEYLLDPLRIPEKDLCY